jgi:hypothetical protein
LSGRTRGVPPSVPFADAGDDTRRTGTLTRDIAAGPKLPRLVSSASSLIVFLVIERIERNRLTLSELRKLAFLLPSPGIPLGSCERFAAHLGAIVGIGCRAVRFGRFLAGALTADDTGAALNERKM